MKNFEKFLYVEKGLQPVTVENHINSIKRIKVKTTLDKNSIEDYVFTLYKSDYSYSHKTNQVKSIEYYFEFIGRPLFFARQKKPKQIIKSTLSESEITRLLFCCSNVREKTIVAVLAYSGVRPKELINIKVGDINFGSNELLIVQGKGFKDGIIYLSSSCVKILLEYLNNFRRNDDDFLFKTFDEQRNYNQQALRKLVCKLSAKANLNKRVYPYLFRHSLATSMINRGADLITVKNQLRHSLIETTMIYIHSQGYCRKNSYEKFVPSYC